MHRSGEGVDPSVGVEVLDPDAAGPVVLSIPHGGTHVPARCRQGMVLPAGDLWSDWDTAELYDLRGVVRVPAVRTGLSRFVADPNRSPAAPLHGDFWTTVVAAQDTTGNPVYDGELDAGELEWRLERAHVPYHQALDASVDTALARHDQVLLLDLHSFGMPLGVDVVLGDVHGTSAAGQTTDRVEAALRAAGFTVARNLRFAGGWTVRRRVGDERVDAVQIELDQRRYLDAGDVDAARPHPRRDPAGWAATPAALAAVVGSLM